MKAVDIPARPRRNVEVIARHVHRLLMAQVEQNAEFGAHADQSDSEEAAAILASLSADECDAVIAWCRRRVCNQRPSQRPN